MAAGRHAPPRSNLAWMALRIFGYIVGVLSMFVVILALTVVLFVGLLVAVLKFGF